MAKPSADVEAAVSREQRRISWSTMPPQGSDEDSAMATSNSEQSTASEGKYKRKYFRFKAESQLAEEASLGKLQLSLSIIRDLERQLLETATEVEVMHTRNETLIARLQALDPSYDPEGDSVASTRESHSREVAQLRAENARLSAELAALRALPLALPRPSSDANLLLRVEELELELAAVRARADDEKTALIRAHETAMADLKRRLSAQHASDLIRVEAEALAKAMAPPQT
eukprot:a844642_10.p1 GENE.a844642_10~~a844642_10.p1  ORF type:complete len:239 (+),score=50.33 a844642_10:27-719(+)